MQLHWICVWLLLFLLHVHELNGSIENDGMRMGQEQCSLKHSEIPSSCTATATGTESSERKYTKSSNEIYQKVRSALDSYTPCQRPTNETNCINITCYLDVINRDLEPYKKNGITQAMIESAANYGTRYQVLNQRLYREVNCMFPSRCSGIEHFLLKLSQLPDIDLVVNTRDWPQVRRAFDAKGPVFSFSKTRDYLDITYPAWTFWAGGPAISLHPTGIGRWDLLRESISSAATKTPWHRKKPRAFFRGSRTSDERDSLVLLSRRRPDLADAQYTKNQAWKSPKDTLDAPPATEVSFEDHCQYKYLFNFRGVAASFRLKHLFLCKSLVFHVGDEWKEFFYSALKPWVHYVPLKSYPNEKELEELLVFFQKNEELAQQIAERGYEFIWQHLRMEDVECYWKKLLKSYSKLLKYKVVANKELVEIKTTKAK